MKKTVIIGSIAAGATVAARLRRLDENVQITIYEKNEYVSSATCGLPYYVGDVIKDRGNLLVQTVESLAHKFNMSVKNLHEVIAIHPDQQTIEVKDLQSNNIFTDHYDDLVIATGTEQNIPEVLAEEHPRILSLKTIQDADQIIAKLNTFIQEQPQENITALVYGTGFVGVELADNLRARGVNTILVGRGTHALKYFDDDLATLIDLQIKVSKIKYYQNTTITSIDQLNQDKLEVTLSDQSKLKVNLIVIATGIKPNSKLASKAGISLNADQSIKVDHFFRTNIPHIYAIGDVIDVPHFVNQKEQNIALAGPAYRQARICANTIAGLNSKEYKGAQRSIIIKINDLTAAAIGLNSKELEIQKEQDPSFSYLSLLVSNKSHAGYYPHSVPILIKAFFDQNTHKLLGAQALGNDGIDKRMDVLAMLMRAGGTYEDLMNVDLCYAPPYSSANDPINFLGFMADNYFNGIAKYIMWSEVEKDQSLIVLDVREPMEVKFNSYEGAINIPLGQLRERLNELPRDRKIAITCAIGVRAYNAARILMQNGFNEISVICGGMHLYRSLHWKPY